MDVFLEEYVLLCNAKITSYFNVDLKTASLILKGAAIKETPRRVTTTDQVFKSAKPIWFKIKGMQEFLKEEDFSSQSVPNIKTQVDLQRNLLMSETMKINTPSSIVKYIPNLGFDKEEMARFFAIMTDTSKPVNERWKTYLTVLTLLEKYDKQKFSKVKEKYEKSLLAITSTKARDITAKNYDSYVVVDILINDPKTYTTWIKEWMSKSKITPHFVVHKDNKTNQIVANFIK